MNRKIIVAVLASVVSLGVFAAPHRPPPHRPVHHAHHHHHLHAHVAIGGFIGGVIGGVVYSAIAADPVVVSQPVVVQQPTVVVAPPPPPPVVVQAQPVAQQTVVQNVWVEGRYVDQVQPNGSVIRVWQPGHYEQRTVIVQ